MAHQSLSSPPLDFTSRHRRLVIFGAEQGLPAPALAHPACCPLRHGEPATVTDHRIPECADRNTETLLKKFGKKRLLLDDNQRRLLAVKAHAIGRKVLLELTTIFTPDTILRWHRELVARNFDSSEKRKPDPPRIRQAALGTAAVRQ